MLRVLSALLASLALMTAACSSSTTSTSNPNGDPSGGDPSGNPSSSSSGACANIAGTWSISGGCGNDTCTITQNGCNTAFKCLGAASYTGSMSGNDAAYAGTTATGLQGTCKGTVNGASMTGTCTVSGVSCSFSAAKK